MSSADEELELLERVFFRICSGSDENLESSVCKFLTPVLLKIASPHEAVRNKVTELCVHISKRLKSRPLIQLPVEALLEQFMDPSTPSVISNVSVVYLKMGYQRLPPSKQAELIPKIVNALDKKSQEHSDILVMLIISALGHVQWPRDPVMCVNHIAPNEKPKLLLEALLDVLLMPYGWKNQTFEAPPGLSVYALKRIVSNLDFEKVPLEKVKQSALKCVTSGMYKPEETLCHLVASSADQWSSVSTIANNELDIFLRSGLDWSNPTMLLPLYQLYLGVPNNNDSDKSRAPADLRLKLKILPQMAKARGKGIIWPICIKVVFDALYGETNVNIATKLISLGLNFCSVMIEQSDAANLRAVARILLDSGLQQLVPLLKGSTLQEKIYQIIGQLVLKVPDLVKNDLTLLSRLFNIISQEEDKEVQVVVRETLVSMVTAYSASDLLLAFLATQVKAPSYFTRLVALRYLSTVFPADHMDARFWILTTTGDVMAEVATQGLKALYGPGFRPGNKWKPIPSQALTLPDFSKMAIVVQDKIEQKKSNPSSRVTVNKLTLPFDVTTYSHVMAYLRLCLLHAAGIELAKDQDYSVIDTAAPIGKYLRKNLIKNSKPDDSITAYLNMNFELLEAQPGVVPLHCILECCGSTPEVFVPMYVSKMALVKNLLKSSQGEIRELCAMLYAVLLAYGCEQMEFETEFQSLIDILDSGGKDLEHLHGCLLALGNAIDRCCISQRISKDWPLLKKSVFSTLPYLEHSHHMLIGASSNAIALISHSVLLPLEDVETSQSMKSSSVGRLDVLKKLLAIAKNPSYPFQVVEEAYGAIGYLCLNQEFTYRDFVLNSFIESAKETKAVDVHICVGKVLVNCVLGPASLSARNAWLQTGDEFTPSPTLVNDANKMIDGSLNLLLEKTLPMPHPNSRQACCIWLFAILKNCINHEAVKNRLISIQTAFFDLLSENNDVVQDVASKGLAMVYESGSEDMRQQLIKMLVDQLTQGRRTVAQVTQDTEIFEKGALGTTPTGENLSTYRELCSLASDLNQPDLIYKFMHLANHNATWTSKMGAAFGFSTIAAAAGKQLGEHKGKIIPKLYRYQFDPTPKVQNSMAAIWQALVPESTKTVDQYHKEIFQDLIQNLTSGQWRVRISCCLALSDFLVTGGKRVFQDCIDMMPELWGQLFRVMDDVHDGTRQAATNTMKTVSKLCIQCCENKDGKSGELMLKTLLPMLLSSINNQVRAVRAVSIKTISLLVKSAGVQLKPHLSKLIPTLLEATSELHESLFTQNVNDAQTEGLMDNVGSIVIKSHFKLDQILYSSNRPSKAAHLKMYQKVFYSNLCVHFIDGEVLADMLPRLVELLKTSGNFASRVATANFLTLLCHHMTVDKLQPHVGKLLGVLVTGLSDKNRTVRRTYAGCIGQLAKAAKDSSLDKLVVKLKTIYLEKEDDNIRQAVGLAFHSLVQNHQEEAKARAETILPLVFFAMHTKTDKNVAYETILYLIFAPLSDENVWEDMWLEVSGGTDGLLKYVDDVLQLLEDTLQSSSWPVRAQSARAMKTIAEKIGKSIDQTKQDRVVDLLVQALQGRTWDGKEHILTALATFCTNCPTLKDSNKVETITRDVLKECKKSNLLYRKQALITIGVIVEALNVDKFEEIYILVEEILGKGAEKGDDSMDDVDDDNKKEHTALREAAFETLGKAWPQNEKTQAQYREKVIVQCVSCLQCNTRSVQVSIMSSVINYIDKLTLLSGKGLNDTESKELKVILSHIMEALSYSLSIPKHTRLRKEALNVMITLGKRLKDMEWKEDLKKIGKIFSDLSHDLTQDNSPEVKTRVIDIKDFFKNLE
ncbi:proteasome adapter and scaffold protein ECM29 [Nilaparvata lugens]|uniref:proteasome adapter and scaffold protein ECM29 n=1 Tax=Nilaparvata lugens TaxID=108931 RepID=UPI00193D2045|nr:proteasome adapter and scaffold protein ECM29 [Nilaparvata lugens]